MKEAAGNPGKRPLNAAEPQPAAGVPKMPGWLSKRAKKEWKRIVPELERLGLMTVVDLAALAAYCQAVAEMEIATDTLDREGRVCSWPIFDKDGVRVGEKLRSHPAVQQQRDAARLVKQFIGEFGLTPASRTRVQGATNGESQDPRAEKFFRNRV
jgi:P27 family predicted phage terminase small subunit